MNIIGTVLSKLFNQNTAPKQAPVDIKQGQLKVLANRFTKHSVLTPKVLTGGAMIAGLWWITNRREKVKEAERGKPR
jgi:hypothetical protein